LLSALPGAAPQAIAAPPHRALERAQMHLGCPGRRPALPSALPDPASQAESAPADSALQRDVLHSSCHGRWLAPQPLAGEADTPPSRIVPSTAEIHPRYSPRRQDLRREKPPAIAL